MKCWKILYGPLVTLAATAILLIAGPAEGREKCAPYYQSYGGSWSSSGGSRVCYPPCYARSVLFYSRDKTAGNTKPDGTPLTDAENQAVYGLKYPDHPNKPAGNQYEIRSHGRPCAEGSCFGAQTKIITLKGERLSKNRKLLSSALGLRLPSNTVMVDFLAPRSASLGRSWEVRAYKSPGPCAFFAGRMELRESQIKSVMKRLKP